MQTCSALLKQHHPKGAMFTESLFALPSQTYSPIILPHLQWLFVQPLFQGTKHAFLWLIYG